MFRISEKEVRLIFDRYVPDPNPQLSFLPEVISFDEKYINKHITKNGYSFVMVDWFDQKILDVYSSRHLDDLSAKFSKIKPEIRSNVKYITMDMYDSYLTCAKVYFNNAIVAVDSFHVIQNLNRAFDKVLNKYIKKYDNGASEIEENHIFYYMLKKGKDLLFQNYGTLSTDLNYNKRLNMHISNRTLVDYILAIDGEIARAYNIMQEYLDFNRNNNRKDAEKEIDDIIEEFAYSGIKSYEEFSRTLSNWKEYILNSFITIYDYKMKKYRRLSDGPIESINNRIEKINVISYGFTKFKNFKKVIMYKINKNLPIRLM